MFGKFLPGRSRLTQVAALNQGFVVQGQDLPNQNVFRDPNLELLDSYFENRQYAQLMPWNADKDAVGSFIPVRKRQPKIKIPYARNLSSIVASKLIGPSVFPAFTVPEDPDAQEYWRAILEISKLQTFLLEPVRRMINTGEVFVRFHIVNGSFKLDYYNTKFCYPTFSDAGEIESVKVQYVYSDAQDKDSNGTPKRKWFRLDLGQETEVTYDNPVYSAGQKLDDVQFTPVETVEHGFGFLQGEWMTTTGQPEGYGLTKDLMDFVDELCYSLSQSSSAVSYNQDPQLTFKGMTAEEMDDVIRSSSKSWQLGRDGAAEFLETNLSGVQRAIELRDKVRSNLSDISRVVMLDPEKIVGSAQSGKAMEVLHGPLKDMIDELRLPVGDSIKKLVMKMGAANILGLQAGMMAPLPLPDGFQLQTMTIALKWPQLFQHTLEDLMNKVGIASKALMSGLISPVTATKFIAEDFGITDLEAEIAQIAEHQAQMAALNPFSGGF